MSNIQIGSLTDNYLNIGFAGKNSPIDTYFFSLTNMGSTHISAEGFSGDLNMEVRDIEGKVIKSIVTSGTNIGTLSIDNLGPADYTLNVSPVSADTNYQVSLTPTGKIDPLTGMNIEYGYFITDQNGKVGFEFLHDGGLYQGEIAIFSLEGMENFIPGSQEFIKEAARRALTDKELGHIVISDATEGALPEFSGGLGEEDFNKGQYQGVKTFVMAPGKAFAVMLVPNGKVQEVFDNPNIGGTKRPLFSLSSSNPNSAFLYGQLADITGDGKAFVIEDQRADEISDKDYNDFIFNLTGATGKAVWVKKLINSAKDWTISAIGKKLIDYVTSKLSVPEPPSPPQDLQFDLKSTYPTGKAIEFTSGKVYDPNGVSDIARVELSQRKQGGDWVKLNDAASFTTDSQGWATFNYSLNNLESGSYELKAIAYDKEGATSNTVLKSFTVKEAVTLPVNQPPQNLQFDIQTAYTVGEAINLTAAKVYDSDGVTNLQKVELSQRKQGGEWVKLNDAASFVGDSQGWATFNYSLNNLESSSYELKAIAYDKEGATSNTVLKSFIVEEATVTPTPTPTPILTPTPLPIPTPTNTAPKDLQFDALTAYTVGEKISFTDGKVYDVDGVTNLTKIEFSQRMEGGEWVKVSNAEIFTADSQGWGSFSYSLSDLSAGNYEVKAIAYDREGATSNTVLKSFTIKEATVTPTPTPIPIPTPTPTPIPTPTPTPINQSPENLQLSLLTTYKPNEAIQLKNAKVFDANGANNLAKIDFWLQKEGGEWTDISDATNFTPDSLDNGWATFNYTLNGLVAGKYQLKAIAYDRAGAASNEIISSLLVNTAPNDLAFGILPLYTNGEEISFEYAKVIDAEGVSDIDRVDFWLQKEGGEKIEITNDVTEFESDSKGRGRFNFIADLSSLTPGRYQLSAMAYDKSGGASPVATEKFVLITDSGKSLSDNVRLAIAGSANLEKYDPEALAQTREWLIWLTPGSSSQQLANSLGAVDKGAAGHIPNTYRWQFPENTDPFEVEQSLLSLSGVEFAYPLVPHQPKLLSEPKDEPLVKDTTQWHLQTSVNPNATVKEAWELAQGKGVVIGIVDDDLFESPHKELTDNFRADLSSDFNQDADPSPTYQRTVIPQYSSSKRNIKDSTPINFPVKVPLTGVVTDVNVQLGIEHPKVYELEGYLISPKEPVFDPSIFKSSSRNRSPRPGDPGSEPPRVELFNNIKNGGINFTNTIFDDEATNPIATALAPFTGSFKPQEPLANVNNQWAPGFWEVKIEKASSKTGKLTQLGLDFTTYNPHATSVAGVAVANGSNGYQGSGVAPKASFAGLRLVADQFTDSDLANVFYDLSSKNRNQSIDIYNNSWKDEDWLSYFGQGVDAMADGVKYGRGGLGNIYVFGGGNDASNGGNVNYNGLANSRYAIAVGAINQQAKKSVYSEPGAALLVSAYSSDNGVGITTADMEGTRGYSEEDYTTGFGGTSAAAPFVSGVVALMLEKNPSLSWRDVQYILVENAQKNDPDDAEWKQNGAGYWVNHKYGFGAVNPVAAVKKAADWTPVAQEVEVNSKLKNVGESIPNDNGETGLSSTIKVNEDINVEKVEVVFKANHKDWGDLTVKLKSPDGTDSFLVQAIPEEIDPNNNDEYSTFWVFTSNRHWGESSKGEWTLEVIDEKGNKIEGYWDSWKLKIYGAKPTLSIEATDANASESGEPGTVTITRRGNTKYDLKVNYSAGGTASERIDYQGLSESVTIPAGQSSVEIPIRVIDDNSVEGEETATITLSTDQGYTIGKNGSATVAIADNDEPPNVVTNTKDNGAGSLRAVLTWANSNPGKDTVIFKIPTTDPGYNSSTNSFTIKPLSQLPHITNSVIIDGTTQLGFLDRPVIELDGSNVGLEDGLYISAGDSTVRGLTINRFGVNAIRLTDKGNNIIEGNFIGTDVTGTQALPNGYSGISVWTTNNIIGGKTLAARNIISGNQNDGIYIEGQNANNNVIEGNYIGSDITGTKSLPNINSGISLRDAPNNTVGGTAIEAGNLIFGNVRNGVFVTGSGATSNAILSNSISSNNLQGIDLGNNGLTLNDLGDGDTGANNLQNFPDLISALSSSGNTTIKGKINSTPNTNLRVEFFSNQNTDASGYGEGEKFLGFQNVTTDSSGNATLAVNLPLAVPIGHFITATATDPNNNTSEFSKGIVIKPQPTELFSDINANLEGVYFSSVASGDYDNDGDLDILLTGINGQNSIAKVYQNNNGNFTDINAALQGVFSSSVDWGDYDRDGDLDILLTGLDDNFNLISKVYRNDNGNFTDINANLQGLSDSSATWSDYDNDGDLDIFLTGSAFAGGITKIYRNDSGSFTDISANLQGVFDGSVDAGDYDKDGDIDILITGSSGPSPSGISKIYRNDNGNFIDIDAALTGVSSSDAAWGDYDNDGDLDILLTGKFNGASPISKIYRNDNGNFIDINAALQGVSDSSVNWGDYDNDGDLDILLSGANQSGFSSKIYRNDGGIFTDISANLPGVDFSSVNWGDYDNDGDLDILLSGNPSGFSSGITKVYRNNSLTVNTVPTTPTGLITSVNGNSVTLNWNTATDSETPQASLTYNLRVGTTPGGLDIMSPMTNSNGTRKVVQMGNVNQNTNWKLKNLKPGTYYWSVQAIDTAFAGSTFATEGSFKVGVGAIGSVGITSY